TPNAASTAAFSSVSVSGLASIENSPAIERRGDSAPAAFALTSPLEGEVAIASSLWRVGGEAEEVPSSPFPPPAALLRSPATSPPHTLHGPLTSRQEERGAGDHERLERGAAGRQPERIQVVRAGRAGQALAGAGVPEPGHAPGREALRPQQRVAVEVRGGHDR